MAAIIRAPALHAIVRAQLQEGTGLHAAESTWMLHVKDVRARGSDAWKSRIAGWCTVSPDRK
jgi:hypothetical protein